MPSQTPKPPGAARRRNAETQFKVLRLPATDEIPELPGLVDEDDEESVGWHPQTVLWWRDVWCSPMRAEYTQADVHELLRLALLVDQFNHKPTKELHAEIRLANAEFGLTPAARRKLRWTLPDVEGLPAEPKGRKGQRTDPRGLAVNQ